MIFICPPSILLGIDLLLGEIHSLAQKRVTEIAHKNHI